MKKVKQFKQYTKFGHDSCTYSVGWEEKNCGLFLFLIFQTNEWKSNLNHENLFINYADTNSMESACMQNKSHKLIGNMSKHLYTKYDVALWHWLQFECEIKWEEKKIGKHLTDDFGRSRRRYVSNAWHQVKTKGLVHRTKWSVFLKPQIKISNNTMRQAIGVNCGLEW